MKDGVWRPVQPNIVFRPDKIYGLPNAQKENVGRMTENESNLN
jgi:hypothetical protein